MILSKERSSFSKGHMPAGTTIHGILKRDVIFLVDSTLFCAVVPCVITIITIMLTKNAFSWPLVLLPFFACVLIYSTNRLTDKKEDAINIPDRIQFPHRIRVTLLVVASIFYVLLLGIVFQKNFLSFAIALLPLVIAFLYSICRLKRFFLVKNISIATAICASVLIVPAYYENWTGVGEMLFLFFFFMLLTNTILFDIKDIKGDSIFGIHTLPVLLGIPATKKICCFLVAVACIMIIPLVFMNWDSILLIPFACTLALATIYAPEGENPPWWYFGIFVDGEYWILLFSALIVLILQ
jgi:4-hydroxybenzoate polyprenyltransferase